MASVISDPNGRKRIQFVDADGFRRTVRLGKCDLKTAEAVKVKVEMLLSAKLSGAPIPQEAAHWLGGVGQELYEKLAHVGLAPPRAEERIIGFLDRYVQERTDLAKRTKELFQRVRAALLAFFGPDKRLRDVSEAEAEAFNRWLQGHYAEATARRTIGRTKQLWNAARKRKLVLDNPFESIPAAVRGNPAREHYVSLEETQKLLEATRDPTTRLLIGLSRFAGLRIPSEIENLRWSDFLWDQGKFCVHSPKLQKTSKAIRWVPIMPELEELLREAWACAPEGEDKVFQLSKGTDTNLRTRLRRLIIRAGLTPWPRLWHSMRASFITDLIRRGFPEYVVTDWAGNSVKVAREHYLMTTESYFQEASQKGLGGIRNGGEGGAKSGALEAQNAAQQVDVCSGKIEKIASEPLGDFQVTQPLACRNFLLQKDLAPRPGLEPGTRRLTAACSTKLSYRGIVYCGLPNGGAFRCLYLSELF